MKRPKEGWAVWYKRAPQGERKQRYNAYMRSKDWAAVRLAAFKAARFQCAQCGDKRGLSAHHVTYARLGNEDPNDLRVLCGACHREAHGARYIPRGVKPPEPERVTPAPKPKRKRRTGAEWALRQAHSDALAWDRMLERGKKW